MSAAEVRDVIFPATGGKYRHRRMDVGDNDNLHLNNCMVLTMRNGVLMDKEWVGTHERKQIVAERK
jgi:hypothetical protein